ncbi:phenylacetate-CoA oxygenase/reductase subunit PaaK [Rhodococcus sp. BP-252]|uniref:1,2-phenylacetyl-CoA epoxidase subunit PaaE n=1 Tax=unclassified Rhodococcus (in: high G+C Gram-positive bacteria) TaxID=192944 RepID=UPI001C9A61DB|nr:MULTISPECIES: 1,2-phenylacetyl-CoA epoxidase subunit PaaE [unclassified Rhodococcus (in: high G+C Gram-positive bacteria)]MBY6412840.1 phenylacetate-CoA oxygenase/reductase subunit PaaK [Rhodococcus sp. BP-320]MBY6417623.1 phenylacetate-CoA oxygenase/reductase subunit PaaK [Rhodococcus sp. BP-321]MBY6423475.1 phenylacetate-CoA oxygenase/reductase subunit PaaK [Rhodococcus sp. BP-324]MBY6427647.1 phenylacetate-CoA oxygenase/reductase subunit PaaK [Rhodococcus sp. BP-323]MBY6432811.1 phenylac
MTVTAEPVTPNARNKPFHSLTVADVESLCDDAVAVTFDVPEHLSDEFDFRPGQSLMLSRTVDGVEHRRSYSICAPAGARPRVGVREVTDGLFSSWLVHQVKAGDKIDVQGPTGNFHADPAAGGRHVLIAAGSGITPMLSIAASVLGNPDAEVVLLYGNRRTRSVMFAEEIADLKDQYGSRFDVIHVLSREPREVQLFSGRLDAERLRDILDTVVPTPDIDHFWLCGPFGMVTDAQQVLGDLGIDKARIHAELFYVDDVPPPQEKHREPGVTGPSSEVTIVLDGRSVTGTLPRDESILDSGEQLRSDLPFACKGGVCGTCRAKVTCGDVDMRRNYALEENEVAAGFVLTCQTFPLSDTVTVDFDA